MAQEKSPVLTPEEQQELASAGGAIDRTTRQVERSQENRRLKIAGVGGRARTIEDDMEDDENGR